MQTIPLEFATLDSPVGTLTLIASARGLCAVLFENGKHNPNLARMEKDGALVQNADNKFLRAAVAQLREYFSGKRKEFSLKLDMRGTVFQQNAWRALQTIPYANTISYGEQAKRLGDAKKARAVGMANGRNPLAIVVPCHRVIGASGALTGFGGGIKAKQFLLEHELKSVA